MSPAETIMVMIEELLQSAIASNCFRLSLVLADDNAAIRLDAATMPNGIVCIQGDEMA